jgi:hypothetical protein
MDRCVDMRLTDAMRLVLEMTSTAIRYGDVAERLCAMSATPSRRKVDEFLRELLRYGFLVTDLRPPLTGGDPLAYVEARLAAIPAAAAIREQLQQFRNEMSAWDIAIGVNEDLRYRRLVDEAQRLTGGKTKALLQIDAALRTSGHSINRAVGTEAVRAAESLLRLSVRPRGPTYLASYRESFVTRYGFERPVPVLELLDPDVGIGPPRFETGAEQRNARRDDALLKLATGALRSLTPIVELDEPTLAALETNSFSPRRAPLSLDLYVQIAARSRQDLDDGNFQIVVGPNIGANGAGRNLGRFCDLLPDGVDVVAKIAALEEKLCPEQHLSELVYRPSALNVANVVICPATRRSQVGLTVTAAEEPMRPIPLSDLHVCVEQDRFVLRWIVDGVDRGEVRTVSGHMLNSSGAPPLCRFLDDVAYDGRASAFG